MFQTLTYVALVLLALSGLACLHRIFVGPSLSDRILGLDALGGTLIGFIGMMMILQDTFIYADAILVLSIISFIGTVTLSKFVERGAVLDRD